jgi:hypothetical protein
MPNYPTHTCVKCGVVVLKPSKEFMDSCSPNKLVGPCCFKDGKVVERDAQNERE